MADASKEGHIKLQEAYEYLRVAVQKFNKKKVDEEKLMLKNQNLLMQLEKRNNVINKHENKLQKVRNRTKELTQLSYIDEANLRKGEKCFEERNQLENNLLITTEEYCKKLFTHTYMNMFAEHVQLQWENKAAEDKKLAFMKMQSAKEERLHKEAEMEKRKLRKSASPVKKYPLVYEGCSKIDAIVTQNFMKKELSIENRQQAMKRNGASKELIRALTEKEE